MQAQLEVELEPYDPVEESLKLDENFDLEKFVERSDSYTPTDINTLDIYTDVLDQIDDKSIIVETQQIQKVDRQIRRKRRSKSSKKVTRNLVRLLTHHQKKEDKRNQEKEQKGELTL